MRSLVSNGKISQRVYIDSILEAVVKPWLEAGQDFVLEEDIVRHWKAKHGLKYYFNCPHFPDLFTYIQKICWQFPKQTVDRKAHWDDEKTIAAIKEGWAKLTQEKINDWVLSMPKRLGDRKGKMTGW